MKRADFFLLACATALVACTDGSMPLETKTPPKIVAHAAQVSEGWQHLVLEWYNDCNGETIPVEFDFHYSGVAERDPTGGFHVHSHNDFNAQGVGQTTGALYNVNQSANDEFNLLAPFPKTTTIMQHTYVISQGSVPNSELLYQLDITVNANGEVTARPFQFRIVCQGT